MQTGNCEGASLRRRADFPSAHSVLVKRGEGDSDDAEAICVVAGRQQHVRKPAAIGDEHRTARSSPLRPTGVLIEFPAREGGARYGLVRVAALLRRLFGCQGVGR